ncbi:TetR family transcriptional regulator [Mycobacterium sp. 852002-51163_SCH5372311]|uniref:TetR/AcrR family transcriptional regulator n=1 Tax=Mycobacterium sp. 852002-51163_SCH5372311 TaxID=1834097 RepID=UPI000801EC10|nr:TetR/AcrR family transcriptional regulator [Mycobacterium sp. 852002-51163_SCH5372311]OBF92819.1 TetR family transcriptional regulator [Mycobacterium sp. 852002-51163_SCH5372311]
MRTHGWGGATPASDEEAIERILDAASEAIDERGADIRIADVARTLGVSRQTVYNYFPGTSSLLEAAATRSGMRFVRRLTEHLAHISDPVDALVECLAYSLEWLPGDKHVQLMLVHDFTRASTGVTSEMGFKFGHALLAGLDVDWAQLGLEAADLDDLVEYLLRILQSFMIDPGRPPRTGEVLRAYLRRWVAPVLIAETSERRLDAIGKLSSRSR